MTMFEDRAYWSEQQILDARERFREGVAKGENASAVHDAEAAALLSSGVPLSLSEVDMLCAQAPSLGRCARP